jgi:hypothetical protein
MRSERFFFEFTTKYEYYLDVAYLRQLNTSK